MTSSPPAPQESRTWTRIVFFWAAYGGILLLAGFGRGFVPPAFGPLGWGLSSTAALLLLTNAMLRRERRPTSAVGINLAPASFARFAIGLLLGCGIYAATVVSVSILAGPIHLDRIPAPAPAVVFLTVATTLALSAMEELGFRGYTLWTLRPALGPVVAQVVVALAFALSHVFYGWPWATVFLGVVPNAVLFGAAATVSGGLAVPLGIHVAVNLARWAVGETAHSGVWTLAVADADQLRVATVAPAIGALVPLLLAAALWLWGWHRSAHDPRRAA